jgi:deazaflavin-dependent oxidoreductase (nitroreductase family)
MSDAVEATGAGNARRPGRGQAVLNLVMRGVLATPGLRRAVSDRVLVIEVVGRKSGRRYRFPVGYVATGDTLLIGTAGRWRRNLRPGQSVRVAIAHRTRTMTADVFTDEEHCREFYRQILAHNPVHGRYAQIRTEADGSPNAEDLRRALRRGTAVVRLQPAAASTSTSSEAT